MNFKKALPYIAVIVLFINLLPLNITKANNSKVYLDIISDIEKNHGIMGKSNFIEGDLNYLWLYDINNDDKDELHIILGTSYAGNCTYLVYSGNQLLIEEDFSGPVNGTYFMEYAINNNDLYIHVHDSLIRGTLGDINDSYYIVNNGEIRLLDKFYTYYEEVYLELIIDSEEYLTDEYKDLRSKMIETGINYIDLSKYKINEKNITKEIYDNSQKEYNDFSWNQVFGNYGDDDKNTIINQIENTLAFTKPENFNLEKAQLEDEDLIEIGNLLRWFTRGLYSYSIKDGLDFDSLFNILNYNYMYIDNDFPLKFEENYTIKEEALDQFLFESLGIIADFEDKMIEIPPDPDFYDAYSYYGKKDGYYAPILLSEPNYTEILPEVKNIYRISKDTYYIDYINYDIEFYLSDKFGHPGYLISEKQDFIRKNRLNPEFLNSRYIYSRGYAIIKKTAVEDHSYWTLLEYDTKPADVENINFNDYKKIKLASGNIDLDLDNVNKFSNIEDLKTFLEEEIKGINLNEKDYLTLTDYISLAFQKFNQTTLKAKKNTITLKSSNYILDDNFTSNINEYVTQNILTLNKNYSQVYRYNISNLNQDKEIIINLDKDLFKSVTGSLENNWIYISVDGSTKGLLIPVSELNSYLNNIQNNLKIILNYNKQSIDIKFYEDNAEVKTLPFPIQFLLPSEDISNVIYKEDELWGGQFNKTTKSILFETKLPDSYTLTNNQVNLTDIQSLDSDLKSNIEFLVSRGIFDYNNNEFNTDGTVTRNEFAKSLVRLFFALDTNAKTTFSDVELDSPFYNYISSGEINNIIKGFDDGTYRGETLITIADVISFAGRTLANKKGFIYPQDESQYLNFIDSEEIPGYARKEIALSVREGLIEQGGSLSPLKAITRLEAADILYKLYMLLYDEPMVMLESEIAIPSNNLSMIAIGGGFLLLSGSATGGFIAYKRRKRIV